MFSAHNESMKPSITVYKRFAAFLLDWTLAIGYGITAANIDFAKAFDSVSHQKLLHNL